MESNEKLPRIKLAGGQIARVVEINSVDFPYAVNLDGHAIMYFSEIPTVDTLVRVARDALVTAKVAKIGTGRNVMR